MNYLLSLLHCIINFDNVLIVNVGFWWTKSKWLKWIIVYKLIIKYFALTRTVLPEQWEISTSNDTFDSRFLSFSGKFTEKYKNVKFLEIIIYSFYYTSTSSRYQNISKAIANKMGVAQRGARTHDPEIKSLMLYRLS